MPNTFDKSKTVKPAAPRRQFLKFLKIFGLGREKEQFMDNLSIMLTSNMPVSQALKALQQTAVSLRMKKIIEELETDVNGGMYFWQGFEKSGLLPRYAISLIKVGEESGLLSENLKVLSRQAQKDRVLKQRIHSAMLYPAIVFSLTITLGTAIAWFILPRLAGVFKSLNLRLPLPTRIMIAVGDFLSAHGIWAVPCVIIAVLISLYLLFASRRGQVFGQALLFKLPGVGELMQEVELSRFGYITGSLMKAGVPLIKSVQLLSEAGTIYKYRNFFAKLKDSLEEGNSFQKSFAELPEAKKLIPVAVQQIVAAGERSGSLTQTFLTVGEIYEQKSETTTKDLSVIIEPILLVVVWLGVALVALAVILPLYNLIGGLQGQQLEDTSPASVSTSAPAKAVSAPVSFSAGPRRPDRKY